MRRISALVPRPCGRSIREHWLESDAEMWSPSLGYACDQDVLMEDPTAIPFLSLPPPLCPIEDPLPPIYAPSTFHSGPFGDYSTVPRISKPTSTLDPNTARYLDRLPSSTSDLQVHEPGYSLPSLVVIGS